MGNCWSRSKAQKPAPTAPRDVTVPAPGPAPAALKANADVAAASPAGALSQYLTDVKGAFLRDLGEGQSLEKWVVCVGNEAGDLDSIASAVGYAFYASQLNDERRFVPLVQTAREDLYLRPENVEVLKSSGIADQDLVCLNDIVPSRPSELGASFALVDHNKLLPIFGDGKVVGVIDHHADEGFYPDANPRDIKAVGSCSSLVTAHFATLLPSPSVVPAALADLLISAVLIDTSLKPTPDGKAASEDLESASFLVPLSTFATAYSSAWVKQKAGELDKTKVDVGFLSGRDLLRRDYKQYEIGAWKYGLATIPVPLRTWLVKGLADDGWDVVQADVEAYANEHGLSMLLALTTFDTGEKSPKKGGRGKHAREMLVYVADPKLALLFDEIAKDPVLKLGEWWGGKTKLDQSKWRVWQQENPKATRKQVAPVVMAIVDALTSQ